MPAPPHRSAFRSLLASILGTLALVIQAGCAVGPEALSAERLSYNEAVKVTTEQQLLLNIVRLRYVDTPSSLAVSAIALQKESVSGAQILPFFEVGDGSNRGLTAILPQAQVGHADRPTMTLTPQDDQEFTRKLFTPMSLDGVLYLARTSWPISTVFRLWLGSLNWVSNAHSGSGPIADGPPDHERFLDGIQALQRLQDKSLAALAIEAREELAGPPISSTRVAASDLLAAVREGYGYRAADSETDWVLTRKRAVPVLRIHPAAIGSEDARRFQQAFRLDPTRTRYDLEVKTLSPFPDQYVASGVQVIDLDPRSLLQVLYFISKGVEVPAAHLAHGIARRTHDASGHPFDWQRVLGGLFRVGSDAGPSAPGEAHVAIRYRDHWFYIDRRDHHSLSTFSLLMEVARLELAGRTDAGPALTLPLGGR